MEKRYQSKLISRRLNDNLAKLSGRRDRSLRNESRYNVATLDYVEQPKFLRQERTPRTYVREQWLEGAQKLMIF